MLITLKINQGDDPLVQSFDEIIIEINGGDQEFSVCEIGGELIVQKIERGQPNRKTRERMTIHPKSFEKIAIR